VNDRVLAFLTDFADQAVILPVLLTVSLVLSLQRRWRVAAAWLIAIPGVLGVLLMLKISVYACGWLLPAFGPDRWALKSPSGHTASAAATYGAIVALTAARTKPAAVSPMLTAFLAAVLLALAVGVTRVQLGAHSLSEVIVAAGIGTLGAVAFVVIAGRHMTERSGAPVIAGAVVMVLLFHGHHLPVEGTLQRNAAQMLRHWITSCELKAD
jgi:membrane-associated phospholipid phosphatase